MIDNAVDLEVAFRNLHAVQDALDALRADLQETNPALFPVVSQTYLRRIRSLEADIFSYIQERPAQAPLNVKLGGPGVPHGKIRVGIAARFLQALQNALIQEGKVIIAEVGVGRLANEKPSLSALMGMNLVTTRPGSFVLSLDLATPQLGLFDEYDVGERALLQLLTHIAELTEPAAQFSGGRTILRSLDRIAALVKPDKVSVIEFSYKGERTTRDVSVTPSVRDRIGELLGRPRAGEETVQGRLFWIDTEKNVCRIRPDGQEYVNCRYVEEIEDDLILAVKKRIEVSGIIKPDTNNPERRHIKLVERFRSLDEDSEDDETQGT
jgi:hypothetical protein